MVAGLALKIAVAIIAAVLLAAAAAQASIVFAPLALAIFIIAIVWPLQHWLQGRMPKLLALAITIVVTVAVCLTFASLVAWGFGRVGRSLVADAPRYQALYDAMVTWLDSHGVEPVSRITRRFRQSACPATLSRPAARSSATPPCCLE